MLNKYSKGKSHGVKRRGESFQASSPRGVTQNMFNFPATSCDSMCGMLTTGSLFETQCLNLILRAGHVGPSAYHMPKFQPPKRKASIQYKLYSLHKQFRPKERLFIS